MPGRTPNDGAGDGPITDARSRAGGTRRAFLATAASVAALPVGGTALAAQRDATATVTFDDQRTDGTTVAVASAALSEGGFVTIHDGVLLDSKGDVVRQRRRFLESVMGVSASLAPGDHRNVQVELFTGVPGRDFERDALQEDQILVAMPHVDSNGNGTYDYVASGGVTDGPYRERGEAVIDTANVTVEGGDGGEQGPEAASVTFDDQSSNGRRVTVASVSLPDHGFVAIHDSSLFDGAVLDSVIGVSRETAGDHEDVPVDLFTGVPGRDFEREALQGDETLVAMPHEDSNENFTYDFVCSGGEQDGPFTRDGEAVVDDARVTLTGG